MTKVAEQAVRHRRPAAVSWPTVGAVAAGGALGALGRYGLETAWPAAPSHFPWSTFVTNVSGCFLIGIVMVLAADFWSAHPLADPFLGVGVLGGYTTFSTYNGDVQRLVELGEARTALVYLAGTLLLALAAAYLGGALTKLAVRRARGQAK